MSPRYRLRSVGSLMEEIRGLYRERPFGHISFLDANFFVHPARTLQFAEALFAWNPEITWSGTGTADAICRHAEVLRKVGALNCIFLEVGIESGNAAALSRFNKWTTVDQNLTAIRLLQEANIDLELDFIMFDPDTTVPDLRANYDFLKKAELLGYGQPDGLYNAMRLYPGTPARERYIELFGLERHHLMKSTPPFVDPVVGAAYRLVKEYLERFQKPVNRILRRLDARYRALEAETRGGSRRAAREAQSTAAMMIRLSHEPYSRFDCLLRLAESGMLHGESTLEQWRCELELAETEELIECANRMVACEMTRSDTTEEFVEIEQDSRPGIGDIDASSRFVEHGELLTVDVQGTGLSDSTRFRHATAEPFCIRHLAAAARGMHAGRDRGALFNLEELLGRRCDTGGSAFCCGDAHLGRPFGR